MSAPRIEGNVICLWVECVVCAWKTLHREGVGVQFCKGRDVRVKESRQGQSRFTEWDDPEVPNWAGRGQG